MADDFTIDGSQDGFDKREDFRVDDTIPITVSPLGKKKSEGNRPPFIDIIPVLRRLKAKNVDTDMLLLVKVLDEKLNFIINQFESSSEGTAPAARLHDLNISAGGLSFSSKECFELGEVLSLTIGLPPKPYTNINVLGEVARVDETNDGEGKSFNIGLKFMHLDAEERQDITKYLFDVQRKQVKAK